MTAFALETRKLSMICALAALTLPVGCGTAAVQSSKTSDAVSAKPSEAGYTTCGTSSFNWNRGEAGKVSLLFVKENAKNVLVGVKGSLYGARGATGISLGDFNNAVAVNGNPASGEVRPSAPRTVKSYDGRLMSGCTTAAECKATGVDAKLISVVLDKTNDAVNSITVKFESQGNVKESRFECVALSNVGLVTSARPN